MTTDHEVKAREIARANFSDQIDSAFHPDETQERLVSAIASALREAEAGEREACAKVAIAIAAKSESVIGVNPEHRSCLEIAAAIRSRNDE